MKVAELMKKLQKMNPEDEVTKETLLMEREDPFEMMSDADWENSHYTNQDKQMHDIIKGMHDNKMFKTGSMRFGDENSPDAGIYATDENKTDLRKYKVIAKVKAARDGIRSGSVDEVDLAHYPEYKKWYDAHREEIDAMFKNTFLDDSSDDEEDISDEEELSDEDEVHIVESKLQAAEKRFNESLKSDFDKLMEDIKNL